MNIAMKRFHCCYIPLVTTVVLVKRRWIPTGVTKKKHTGLLAGSVRTKI